MPIIEHSNYSPPFGFKNKHLQTILPTLTRKVRGICYERERITTPDEDFIDLDWSKIGSRKVTILCHGLESGSGEPYMMGMVKALNRRGWDAAAMNFRGCSGEPNKRMRSYHSGASDDLQSVLKYIQSRNRYEKVSLIGFSPDIS